MTTPNEIPSQEKSGSFPTQVPAGAVPEAEDNVTLRFTAKSLMMVVIALLGLLGIGGTGALLNRTPVAVPMPTPEVDSAVKADIKEMKETLKILPVMQAQLTQAQNDRARSDKMSDDHEARLRALEQSARRVTARPTPE